MSADPAQEVNALYDSHYGAMLRFAYLLTYDRALSEDLVQDAFVKLWQRRDQLPAADKQAAYLRTTVLNIARMRVRRLRLERRHRLGEITEQTSSGSDDRLDLQRAIATLPLRKRACLVLRYYCDLDEAETAAALGVSKGTVKSQTSKAIEQLRRRIRPGVAATPTTTREPREGAQHK